ncbi:MAG: hypothetical protein ACR2G4_05550 [Pyrinomonadaceae bacterium]
MSLAFELRSQAKWATVERMVEAARVESGRSSEAGNMQAGKFFHCCNCHQRAPSGNPARFERSGLTEFLVNSSNRFSAVAEAALPNAGQSLSGQCGARFNSYVAELSFVLPTRPAVVRKFQIISPAQSARRRSNSSSGDGVASHAR